MIHFKDSSTIVKDHIEKHSISGDGSDTSSIDTDASTPYLDTQKQVIAVRANQFSNYKHAGADGDGDLFQAMNPHVKVQTKP